MTLARLCIAVVLLQATLPHGAISRHGNNHHVVVGVSLADSILHAGDTSSVFIQFVPAEGFHVNSVPPPYINFAPGIVAPADSGIDLVSLDADVLDTRVPVRKSIVISGHASSRRFMVTGTLYYYYCSDSEGWCARRSLAFTMPLTVIQ